MKLFEIKGSGKKIWLVSVACERTKPEDILDMVLAFSSEQKMQEELLVMFKNFLDDQKDDPDQPDMFDEELTVDNMMDHADWRNFSNCIDTKQVEID